MSDSTMLQRFSEVHFHNDIGMYYCGKRIRTPHHTYGPGVRNHYLLVLVEEGQATLHDGMGTQLQKHDLFVMCPDQKIHYTAQTPWTIHWVGLYGETVAEYMNHLGVTPQHPILHISLFQKVKSVMEKLYEISNESSLDSRLTTVGLIYELFSVLLQNAAAEQKSDPISAILNRIHHHYCEPLSIERLAEEFSMDPAYLSRKFTERQGVSPKQYLLRKRMERAKELLCTTDASIFEIAVAVGYEDQLYFSRIFKKHTGLSPSDFRRQHALP